MPAEDDDDDAGMEITIREPCSIVLVAIVTGRAGEKETSEIRVAWRHQAARVLQWWITSHAARDAKDI